MLAIHDFAGTLALVGCIAGGLTYLLATHPQSCTDQLSADGKQVVQLCRPMAMSDPRFVFILVAVGLLALAEISELRVGDFITFKRRVENDVLEAKSTAVEAMSQVHALQALSTSRAVAAQDQNASAVVHLSLADRYTSNTPVEPSDRNTLPNASQIITTTLAGCAHRAPAPTLCSFFFFLKGTGGDLTRYPAVTHGAEVPKRAEFRGVPDGPDATQIAQKAVIAKSSREEVISVADQQVLLVAAPIETPGGEPVGALVAALYFEARILRDFSYAELLPSYVRASAGTIGDLLVLISRLADNGPSSQTGYR